ncbi:MAG TPA: glycosyltransferase family 4 protein [Gemmataceae bacterium]|nr:glycosyltransferase family 4 protein [Gemmataceae bacterium]
MRVLHLSAGNLYGGIETFLVTLATQRHHGPGMEPHFGLCFEGQLSGELRDAGAPVRLLGAVRVRRPWTVWRARRRLHQLLASGAFDVAVCHGCWPHAVAGPVLRRRGLPLVFYAHGMQTGRHWLEWWARRTRPDLVIANSRVTASSLAELFPATPAVVLHYPVAAPSIADRARARREVRQALRTPEGAVVIVQASRLEPWKGHGLLLEALGRLADLPGWVCWVAGGPQRPEEAAYLADLRRTADRLRLTERVQFLGQRSDVPDLLAAADVHCQPNSGPEPFGIAFVEGLHAGLPVVTTAMGGALEIVTERCGALVPPHDAAALADELRRLIEDPARRRHLGDGGRSRATELCDPRRQLERLAGLLGEASSRSRRSA